MMPDREKVIKWLEYDYFPRVGAYRKDCKQGCDACMPMHDGDDYCDIDMLCKILAMLKEQEEVKPYIDIDEAKCPICKVKLTRQELLGDDVLFEDFFDYCPHCGRSVKWE